jgi:hypothetical protein
MMRTNLSKVAHVEMGGKDEERRDEMDTGRKEKGEVRDQAEEEGYIIGAKGDDRPRTEKEAQVGTDAREGKSLALILYGRFVSSPLLH